MNYYFPIWLIWPLAIIAIQVVLLAMWLVFRFLRYGVFYVRFIFSLGEHTR